jgi:Histidine kinase-, DNA gyrase B-, and HSP90-like ATPase
VAVGSRAGRPQLTVVNTGPDITADDLHRLFQPFERLSPDPPPGDGLGLGLSIVQAIASAHGAAVSATPRPSGGLNITVSFPPASRPEHPTAPAPARRHAVSAATQPPGMRQRDHALAGGSERRRRGGRQDQP